ncbi:MAG: hypothetical protein ACO3A2_01425 [Bdellovibrionia bacterium]
MARDDEEAVRKRIRQREDEREAEEQEEKRKKQQYEFSSAENTTEKLLDLMTRADPLIDQLNNLYNQYFSGAEKTPPNERRKILDQIMATLQLMSKPTASALYRYTTVQSKYLTFRDRWDKRLKDLENGKMQALRVSQTGRKR